MINVQPVHSDTSDILDNTKFQKTPTKEDRVWRDVLTSGLTRSVETIGGSSIVQVDCTYDGPSFTS